VRLDSPSKSIKNLSDAQTLIVSFLSSERDCDTVLLCRRESSLFALTLIIIVVK
jgi:hypothetical protein